MEMNAVHVSELHKPGKEFPKAMFLAMGLVLLIFILPALAITGSFPLRTFAHRRPHAGVRGILRLLRHEFLTPVIGL